MVQLTDDVVERWANSVIPIQRGDHGEDVEILQRLGDKVGFPCIPDKDFGPKTERVVEKFQEMRIILPDSVAGPMTRSELARCWKENWYVGVKFKHISGIMVFGSHHPELGEIPGSFGKMSTFGGPKDWGDLMYGQALLSASSPQQVKEKYPELVDLGIFRADVESLPKLSRRGRDVQAGISWMLNPDSFYLAMRWRKTQRKIMRGGPQNFPVLVGVPSLGKWCTGIPTDYGPAKWTKRVCDLSPGFEDTLEISTDAKVVLGWPIPIQTIGLV